MKTFKFSEFFGQIRNNKLEKHVLQFQSYLTLQQYEPVYQRTLDYLQINGKALDWGCGNGHFSYFLLQQNIQVTGYSFDPPPPFLLDCINFHFVAGNSRDPKTLPLNSQSFDYIFSIGVLEHVHETGGDELESILEIFRVLKPGGVFLCFHFPNQHQWVEALVEKLKLNVHIHNKKYTEAEIKNLVSRSGLTLESIGLYNFLPRNPFVSIPKPIRDSRTLSGIVNLVDRVLTYLLPRYCTNYYFVARKTAATAEQHKD